MRKKRLFDETLIHEIERAGRAVVGDLQIPEQETKPRDAAQRRPDRASQTTAAAKETIMDELQLRKRAAKIQAESEYAAHMEMFEQAGVTLDQYCVSRVITLAYANQLGMPHQMQARLANAAAA